MQTSPTTSAFARTDLSNAEYHANPAVSKSQLDLIRRAPALYKHRLQNKGLPTPAMMLGTLTHTAVLEPDRFDDEIMVAPKIDRRTSAGKAEWESFLIASEGKELIEDDQLDRLRAIRASVMAHPVAAKALSQIETVEQSVFWTDPQTGLDCRCRPDAVTTGGLIVDLKTTKCAAADDFAKSIANYRYHVQAAFYSDGMEALTGTRPRGFVFIAVETEPPFLVAAYAASEAMILRGRADYLRDLETLRECRATDTWPGYSNSLLTLDLPKWV